ncbi:MAG TPA: hypothetical protein VG777_02470 [Thermoanaerobaculia bacterium]|nr:hypothetical protein [Thermoanaerobaculia bacterium]
MRSRGIAGAICAAALLAGTAAAAESGSPEFPRVSVGGVLFADYTYQAEPAGRDAEGNTIRQNSFNVSRAYVNVIASLSQLISVRITPDVVRDTDASGTLSGSYVYRLKLAFAQLALDDTLGKGSWVRFGLHTTPYLDYLDGIYRYRFQGNLFLDREGYIPTADLGISARYVFPADYGEVIVGGFNGEGFTRSEVNDQKSLQVFASLRPAPRAGALRGLRIAAMGDYDHYERNAPRYRVGGAITFEHPIVHAGVEYFAAKDRPTATSAEARGRGWSAYATPRTAIGLEALLRYDHLEPDRSTDEVKTRAIGGIAYWFPVWKGLASAVLLDYERVRYSHYSPPRPTEERYAVHTLVSF